MRYSMYMPRDRVINYVQEINSMMLVKNKYDINVFVKSVEVVKGASQDRSQDKINQGERGIQR